MKDKSIVTFNIPVNHPSTTSHTFIAHLPKKPKPLSFTFKTTDGHLIWTQARRKGFFYRSIFLLFSIFFASLALFSSQVTLLVLFPFLVSSILTIKKFLIFLCGILSLWSLCMAIRLDPFHEQVLSMKEIFQKRVLKSWKPFEMAEYNYNNRGYHRYCYYETEEIIEKAIDLTLRDHMRLKKTSLSRKQRFLEKAQLLENLENQLEFAIRDLKEKLKITSF